MRVVGGGDFWMRMAMMARAWSLACLAALSSCGKPASPAGSTAVPARKPGLWEQSLIRDGRPGRLGGLKVCLDAAADAKLGVFGRRFAKGDCRRSVTRDATGAYHFSSRCSMSDGAVVSTRGIATGDFQSGYDVHSNIEISGATIGVMNGEHDVTLTGRYRGPCPAGMKPGDVNLGSGLKITIDQLSRLGALAPGGGI